MASALILDKIDFKSFRKETEMDFIHAFILLLNSYKVIDAEEGRTRPEKLSLDYGRYKFSIEVSKNLGKPVDHRSLSDVPVGNEKDE